MFLNCIKKLTFTDVIIFISLLLVGSFHEYISCILTTVMCAYLLLQLGKGEKILLGKDILTASAAAICLFYVFSCFWAVDRGMAFIGVLKYLPLFLYAICLQQEKRACFALAYMPYFASAMVVVSCIGMQFPIFRDSFSVAGRLAGFFQYPNTFAAFLMVSELLLFKKVGKKIWDYLALIVLIGGLLYTGSRAVFVIAILANCAMLFSVCKRNVRSILLGGLVTILIAIGVLLLVDDSIVRRYLSINLTESTFVGRLLYWFDALRLLIKYPLGMGYMGYYYVQQSVQTGVYSVVYAHNDFLQLMLDIGLLPTLMFLVAIITWFFSKDVAFEDRIIVGALCIHSFFDFNLQFVGIFMLLLLLLFQKRVNAARQLKTKKIFNFFLAALISLAVYMGSALMLSHWNMNKISNALYPYNTQNKLTMLEQSKNIEEANTLADEILKQNTAFYAPYSIAAEYSYTKGDFSSVIRNMRKALEKNPLEQAEYEKYCKMLLNAIATYQKNGDKDSVSACVNELLSVQRQLASNGDRLSPLGKLIKDQPITELSTETQEYIDKLIGE